MKYPHTVRHALIVSLVLLTTTLLVSSPAKLGAQDHSNTLTAADGDPQTAVFVDAEGKLGLGTEAPEAKLHVADNSFTTSGPFSFKSGESSVLVSHGIDGPGSISAANYKLRASATGIETFVSTASIGVDVSAAGSPHFTINAESPNMPIIFKAEGEAVHILTTASPPSESPEGGLLLGIQSEYKWIQSYGGALALNPQGGNVGIGTSTPQAKLTVAGEIFVVNTTNNTRDIEILGGGGDGFIALNDNGQSRLTFAARDPSKTGGLIRVENGAGESTVEIHGDAGDGSGRITTSVLEITGGSDLAELFDVTDTDTVEPGMVVAIDPDHPGKLRLAQHTYDRMVAGVVSGAGGIQAGLTLHQPNSDVAGNHAVALTGRVYVWADAANGAIQPGDLLTTSDSPGHAMKVTDYEQAQGAILGKAMSKLEQGKGLVLVLVTLQ